MLGAQVADAVATNQENRANTQLTAAQAKVAGEDPSSPNQAADDGGRHGRCVMT